MSIRVRPMADMEDFTNLNREAHENGTVALFPTHIITKTDSAGGIKIVGHLSICNTPVVDVWFHTERMNARDSLCAIKAAEEICRGMNLKTVIVPVDPSSPFKAFGGKMLQGQGLHFMKSADLYFKDL